MFNELRELIGAYKARDPAARSSVEIFLLYPGVRAVRRHRRANWCYRHGFLFLSRYISQRTRHMTGIEIHPGATIGKRLVIDHGMGVVIGETAEIGNDVLIYQGATLGGTGKDQGKRHPTIGNNVLIGSGAKILGPFTVGDNARIASNAVVLKEVPADSTAVGVPARVVRISGVKIDFAGEVDQISITDPVSIEISALRGQLDVLEKYIESRPCCENKCENEDNHQ